MKQVNLANKYVQPSLEYGTVIKQLNDLFEVSLSFGVIEAKKAAGCLVNPEQGDMVLLSVDIEGKCYVLNVLERQGTHAELVVPGDCTLVSSTGRLSLKGVDVSLSAADKTELVSGKLEVAADKADITVSKVTLLGKKLYSQVKRITTIAKSIDQHVKMFTQRAENSERFIKDHEEVQTGSTRYLVEDTLTTQAGNTLNISEELHTMHAEQIHMS